MSDKRESRLIRRVRKKQDKKAAEELIKNYYKEIYVYVFRQTGDKETAMDITQDIFLGMLLSIWSYDEAKSGFRTWLYHIAVHKVADYYRNRANTVNHNAGRLWQTNAEPDCADGLWQLDAPTDENVEQQAINGELARQIFIILREEDMILEELFRLKFYSECTFTEIAEILNLPESTVKTKYYTTLKKLRKELE
ncbi:MAG: RNA polymerase sigma factor [Lachnospiraceae bacterium]|nr:RNA polymerase sigma factor [Lachnospiraceae bacterium]